MMFVTLQQMLVRAAMEGIVTTQPANVYVAIRHLTRMTGQMHTPMMTHITGTSV